MNTTAIPGWGARPSDLPLIGERPRPKPETHEVITAFANRQPALRDWLLQRAAEYRAAAPSWPPAIIEFAAARDLVIYQLQRPLPEIIELLQVCSGARSTN